MLDLTRALRLDCWHLHLMMNEDLRFKNEINGSPELNGLFIHLDLSLSAKPGLHFARSRLGKTLLEIYETSTL